MKKFSSFQKVSGWPAVCHRTNELLGKEKTDEIFDRAQELYEKYAEDRRECRGIRRVHVMSAVAIGSLYLPLRDQFGPETAARMLEEAEKPASDAKHNKVEKLPAPLFMKVAFAVTSIMFGEGAGFKRRWKCNTSREKRFDLLTCPYVEVLKAMGCPEVCPVICIQDDYSFSNMKNGVLFERTRTLGRGDDCCDFCYRIPDKTPRP